MRDFVADVAKNPEKYVENPKDFSRKRKLDLSKIVFLQIGLLKHSLQNEINKFFDNDAVAVVSKSALCQSRKKFQFNFTKISFKKSSKLSTKMPIFRPSKAINY
jgi:hypothetical protein